MTLIHLLRVLVLNMQFLHRYLSDVIIATIAFGVAKALLKFTSISYTGELVLPLVDYRATCVI